MEFGVYGDFYNKLSKTIFYLLKGDYRFRCLEPRDFSASYVSLSLYESPGVCRLHEVASAKLFALLGCFQLGQYPVLQCGVDLLHRGSLIYA